MNDRELLEAAARAARGYVDGAARERERWADEVQRLHSVARQAAADREQRFSAGEAAERERLLSELRRMHDEQADRSVWHNYYLYAANVLAGKILPQQGEAPSTLPLVTLDQAEAMVAAERERCLDVRLSDDDALRFACRVLESDAPDADKAAARDGLMAIRVRIRA
jgi:hypothetical protein